MPSSLPLASFYGGRMLNIGHRGASHDAPANTMASFELAAQYGADGIELDVQLSADNQLVVIHNDTVDETTDGTGAVAEKSLAELRELDAGSYFSPQFAGEQVPTLAEVLEAFGERLLINIELKGINVNDDGMEGLVAEQVNRFGLASRVLISSFNPLRLRRMRKIAPDLPLGYLHRRDIYLHYRIASRLLLLGMACEADHVHDGEVTRAYVAAARRRRQRVHVWVVNDPDRMSTLRDLGVDMIITDRPDVLRAVQHGER